MCCATCLLLFITGREWQWLDSKYFRTMHLLAASYLKSSPVACYPQTEPHVHPLGAGLPPVWGGCCSPCLSDFCPGAWCCPTYHLWAVWPHKHHHYFGAGALHLSPQPLPEVGVTGKASTSLPPAKTTCHPPAPCSLFPSRWPLPGTGASMARDYGAEGGGGATPWAKRTPWYRILDAVLFTHSSWALANAAI